MSKAVLWQPTFWTPPHSGISDGWALADFAEAMMTVSKGFRAGAPLRFTNWQKWLVASLLERRMHDNRLRYRRAIVGLPRKNGKSLLGASIILHHLLEGPHGAEAYSAAGSRQQASIIFDEVRQQVLQSPTLSKHIKAYRTHLYVPRTNSVYRALSAEAMQAHGLNPSLVVADELHGWPSNPNNRRGDELWAALESGSGARPESLLLGISTAGGNLDTLWGKLYEYGKKVASGEVDDDAFGAFWWDAPQSMPAHDPATWHYANPNLAEGLFDEEDFHSSVSSATEGAGLKEFQRYRLNQWVRTAGEEFMSRLSWDAAHRKGQTIKPGSVVFAGFDGSVTGDATALMLIDEAGLLQIHKVWEPDHLDPDWSVPRDEVNSAVEDIFEIYDCKMLFADPSFFETDVADWENKHRRKVMRIPPTGARMAPMAKNFVADIASLTIGHQNEPILTRHVLNAIADDYGSFKKEKRGSSRKIDLLAASVLANGARTAYLDKKRKRGMVW